MPNLDLDLTQLDRDDFQKFFNDYLENSPIREQSVVRGRVINVEGDWVTVDIGYKAEGVIPKHEFLDADNNLTVKPGDEVDVYLDSMEEEDGQLVLSKEKADQMKAWDEISKAVERDEIVRGVVLPKLRGNGRVVGQQHGDPHVLQHGTMTGSSPP